MAYTPDTTNPYAPPRADLRRARDKSDQPRSADRGTRLGAAILDGILFGVIAFAGVLLVGLVAPDLPAEAGALLGFGVAGLYGLYNAVLLATRGQTVGKRLLGIKIVRADGRPAGFGRAVALRVMVPNAIAYGLILGLGGAEAVAATARPDAAMTPDVLIGQLAAMAFVFGGMLLIFGSAKRCLHDYIAGTIVVKA
jgi:uncharacterized RDD family membrane protein YckC